MNLNKIALRIASSDIIPNFNNLPKNKEYWKNKITNPLIWGMSGALLGQDPETIYDNLEALDRRLQEYFRKIEDFEDEIPLGDRITELEPEQMAELIEEEGEEGSRKTKRQRVFGR